MKQASGLLVLLLGPAVMFGQGLTAAEFRDLDPEAAQEIVQEAWARHSVIVSGSSNPAGVPFSDKLVATFRKLAREQDASPELLTQRFEAGEMDIRVLGRAVQDNAAFLEQVNSDVARKIGDVCTHILAGSVQGGTNIAAYYDAVERERIARIERHYLTILGQLTESARGAVLRLADTEARRMVVSTISRTGIAADIPEVYEAHAKQRCMQAAGEPASRGRVASSEELVTNGH